MNQRTWAVTLAAVMLAGTGLALATNVAGQDFERQGEITSTATAYAVDWDDDEAGKLRLSMDPVDGATAPRVLLSIFEDDERVGTFTLDEDWPRLDHRVEPSDDVTLVVHRIDQAEIDVLSEEGAEIDLDRLDLTTRTVELADGSNEAIRTQVSLDVERPIATLGLSLDGDVEGLEIVALNGDDEPVLEADVASADTSQGDRLAPTLIPDDFQHGSMLVRLSASTLNGSLALEIASLADDEPNVIQVSSDTNDSGSTDGPSTNTSDDGSSDTSNTTVDEPASGSELIPVANLTEGTPVALSVPEGIEALHVVGEEDCGTAILFGPDDQLVGTAMLDEDEGAREWNASDEEDSDGGEDGWDHSHDDRVAITLPVSQAGEHVLLLEDAHEDAKVYMRVDDPDAVEHRELEVREVEGQIEGNETRLFSSSNATAEETLDAGLIGFSWHSQGADVHREVRLTGPDGETIYEAEGVGATHLTVRDSEQNRDPLVGPAGDYTIETESRSALDDGMAYTFHVYER